MYPLQTPLSIPHRSIYLKMYFRHNQETIWPPSVTIKKRDIIEYIQEKTSDEEILFLRPEDIVEEFSDEHHNEEVIREILYEITEEEQIRNNEFSMEIFYPEKEEERVEQFFKPNDRWDLPHIFFAGFYIIFVSVLAMDINPIFLDASDEQIIWIGFVSIIASYYVGQGVRRLTKTVEARVPTIREYSLIIYSTVFVIILVISFLAAYSHIFTEEIPPTAIGAALPTSILAGVQLGRYLESKSQSQSIQSE